MSLFKVRDFWEASGSDDEEFSGGGSICYQLIDGLDCLITGNLAGLFRVYHIESLAAYKADNLLLEVQMDEAILQLEFANAMGNSSQVEASIQVLYEHRLERCSYVFTKGPFGGVVSKDLICVESVDGVLSIFDQDSHAFDRPLPGVVLPGPIAYISETDSFATISSSYTLDIYRYQALASATLANDAQDGIRGKRVTSERSKSLGEMILDLRVVDGQNEQLIFALGEHTLFVMKTDGEPVYSKRFDFSAKCFHIYRREPNDAFHWTMIASQNNTILIFEKTILRWAAQVDDTPGMTAVIRVDLTFQKGTIVVLNDDAKVRLCYLGTSPSLYVSTAPERRELPEDADELRKLEEIANEGIKLDESYGKPLNVHLQLGGLQMMNRTPTQTVQITIDPPDVALDARVIIVAPPSFLASPTEFNLSQCQAKTILETSIQLKQGNMPFDLELKVSVIYRHPKLGIKASHSAIDLPIELVARVQPNPPRTAKFKITVESSQPALSPSDLFPSLVKDTASEIEFEYFNESRVGFFATANKYRIQGDSYSSLALVLNESVKRIRTLQNGVTVRVKPPVLDDFLQVIADYIQAVVAFEDTEKRLEQLAGQYRAVEKRLLAKTKDKTPSPFNNLDKLLEMTHHDLLRTADEGIRAQNALPLNASCLNAAANLAAHLLALSGRIQPHMKDLFANLFQCQEEDPFTELWEEHTTVALCSLMKELKIGKGLHESSGLQALLAILWDNQFEGEQNSSIDVSNTNPEEAVEENELGKDGERGNALGEEGTEGKSVDFEESAEQNHYTEVDTTNDW